MRVVLDAYGLMVWLLEEPSYKIVEDYLTSHTVFMSPINFGEVYYRLIKNNLIEEASNLWNNEDSFPIKFIEPTCKRIRLASEIKGKYPVSYADSFCIALGIELNAPIITGDPKFKEVNNIKLIWLK